MSEVNRYEDPTPVRIEVETTKGALTALLDHPALLSQTGDGNHFVNGIHRAVQDFRNPRRYEVG